MSHTTAVVLELGLLLFFFFCFAGRRGGGGLAILQFLLPGYTACSKNDAEGLLHVISFI